MTGRTVLLDHIGSQEAAALMVDGKIDDLLIDTAGLARPGAIFRAICDRPLKGQGGMMMRLPEGAMGFLRQGKGLRPGQPLLVQVTGYAEEGKAVPLTDRILFKSRYAIVTPGAPGINVSRAIIEDDERDRLTGIGKSVMTADHGLILRSSCEGAAEDDIAEDIAAMVDLANAVMSDADGPQPEALTDGDGPHVLAWREWTGVADVVTQKGCFASHGVLDQIGALRDGLVPLGEGSMWIETTRALVAIDVNTGGDTSPAAALKVNLAACRAIPRALRLRGWGGQIVIDFAPMSKAHRKQVEQSLRASFRNDPIETSLVGWTAMGLFEAQRKRERLPVSAVLRGGL